MHFQASFPSSIYPLVVWFVVFPTAIAPAFADCTGLQSRQLSIGGIAAAPLPPRSGLFAASEITASLPKDGLETLSFQIPATRYPTGVLTVKIASHGTVAADNAAHDLTKIRLHRDAYNRICHSDENASEYNRAVDRQPYVDFHYGYEDNDDRAVSISNLHADIGYRHARLLSIGSWGAAINARLTTDRDPVRGQFLFDDQRTSINPLLFLARIFSRPVSNALKPAEAHADSYPGYVEYLGHTVQVIPYRKFQNRSKCLEIPITLPKNGEAKLDYTDIMIFDADDVLLSAGVTQPTPGSTDENNGPLDPQQTWRIRWTN